MRVLFGLIAFGLLVSCSGESQNASVTKTETSSVSVDTMDVDTSSGKDPDMTWAMMDVEGAEEARFDVYTDEYILEIYDLAANDTQVVQLKTDLDIQSELPDDFFDFKDYNFDGYTDFSYRVIEGSGVAYREYWVKDPSTNRFVHHDALSDMPAVIINEEDSTLVNNSSSMAGMHYTRKTYVPEGLVHLTLVSEETQGPVDSDSDILYYKKTNYYNEGPVVACYMVIRTEGKVENHCIEEGSDCPEEFIYLDPDYDKEVRLVEVDGPCPE